MALGGLLPGGAAAEETEAPAPIRARFELPEQGAAMGEAMELTLVAEPNPEAGADLAGQAGSVDLLLRLPNGIRLDSEGWELAEIPAEERGDETGPWRLYERSVPAAPSTVKRELLREPVLLAVTEEGLNWVVTARVRVAAGARQWQALTTVFATTEGDRAEFHEAPRL
ncbi:MAG: hypothetical protein HYZ95_02660 [Candidatus Omnitrophica bacterium]|nr:hypothetical protein [Candidatus Omnitrophota bacterium]